MDLKLKEGFIALWKRFFGETEFPITFYYTDEEGHAELVKPGSVHRCVIAALSLVRQGQSLSFDAKSIGCPGGQMYFGFHTTVRPDFEYFLSCGIPGKMEGERYKKTPEIAAASVKITPTFKTPARFIVFKRWDALTKLDEPAIAVFFAQSRRVIRSLHSRKL